MMIVNMTQFRVGRTEQEAQDAVRRLFLPFVQPAEDEGPHIHQYAIVLVSKEDDEEYELSAFEAPCPARDIAGNIRAIVQALRDGADEMEAGHADILAEDEKDGVDISPPDLVDVLSLVQVKVTEAEVATWTQDQRKEALAWASAAHLSASDNDNVVPDQPTFLAQGDFQIGDIVRNRKTGAVMQVTGGGIWLKSWYELVSERKYDTPGPGAVAGAGQGDWSDATNDEG